MAFANGSAVATVEKHPTVVALEECSDEAGMAANGARLRACLDSRGFAGPTAATRIGAPAGG